MLRPTNRMGPDFSFCIYSREIVHDTLLADGRKSTNESMAICIVEADWCSSYSSWRVLLLSCECLVIFLRMFCFVSSPTDASQHRASPNTSGSEHKQQGNMLTIAEKVKHAGRRERL